jgi:F-type H+-transporting ATPase subunit alpha
VQRAIGAAFAGLSQARTAFIPALAIREVGTITRVSTGIATVTGLPSVGCEELVSFPGGLLGIAFNVDPDEASSFSGNTRHCARATRLNAPVG